MFSGSGLRGEYCGGDPEPYRGRDSSASADQRFSGGDYGEGEFDFYRGDRRVDKPQKRIRAFYLG